MAPSPIGPATSTPPDQYGQIHPIETDELIAAKRQEFETELAKISEKQNVEMAQQRCPELLTDDFKLMFLRCEVFQANLAAKRYVSYWNKRVEIFGSTKAFQPLTLDQALKDDMVALSLGVFQLLPAPDPDGHAMVFLNPSRLDPSRYPRESMCRALWYMLHAALESPSAQQRGIVFLGYPRHARITQLDRKLMKLNMESIKQCLPVRLSAAHMCHPPTFFAITFPLIKFFLGERLRKRLRVHSGSQDKVLAQLATFGLSRDMLPTDLGGNLSLDIDGWLEERKANGQ